MDTHQTSTAFLNTKRTAAEPRVAALAEHLDEDVTFDDKLVYDDVSFRVDGRDYMVLTDEEADARARESISETLWAFNTSFLSRFVPALRDERARKAWERMAGELCEDTNPLVEALIGLNISAFYEAAIDADGRGHFLSGYDGEEHEVTVDGVRWYIYRTN